MDITQLKVWHWTLIGGLLGAVLAFAGPGPSRNRSADKIRTISQRDFEEAILAPSAGAGNELANIVVHPKLGSQGYWVTGSWTHAIRVHADPADHRSRLVAAQMTLPIKFLAGDPYQPIDPKLGSGRTNVFAVLDRAGQLRGARPAYRYGWAEQPMLMAALWTLGSMALIGGVWPTILGFLVGAGFGPVNEDTSLRNLRGVRTSDNGLKKAEARLDELLESIAEYEAELGLSDEGTEPLPDEAAVRAPPSAIRELSAAPLEQGAPGKAEAEKDFGGEFYPTVVHHETPHISVTEL